MKDEEIDNLNDAIQKITLNNYDLEMAIEKELELRNKYEAEQRRIANYCNDLKLKFKNVDKTISDYETTIASMKEENIKLADAYDKKIEQIEKENKKIVTRIDDRIDVFNHQKAEIIENETKVDDLIKEIEQQKTVFEERSMLNKIKYDELEKKYANLQKKIYELQINCEIKKAENVQCEKRVSMAENEKGDIERQIKEYEISNEKLTNQINDLTKQWKELSSVSIETNYKGKRSGKMTKTDRTTARSKYSGRKD